MNRTNQGISIEEAYMAFDMRESYLQRHASPMGMQADTTELQMKDFTTKSCNVWKAETDHLSQVFSDGCVEVSEIDCEEEDDSNCE